MIRKYQKPFCILVLLCILIVAAIFFYQNRMYNIYGNVTAPIAEEQIPDFLAGDPAYAMGRNSMDMPIFKDPDAAFAKASADLQTGIAAIQEQFDLEPFSPSTWEPYKIYGAQIVTEDESLREACMRVSVFLDYYENSFPD